MTKRPRKSRPVSKRGEPVPRGALHWPLADRGPIEIFDEYTNEVVHLTLGQRDPVSIEGLLIDFRYVSRDEEVSRRCLLGWQCGRNGKRIYVRGYCPFREGLRTFRVDRMQDVMVMQAGRYVIVDDIAPILRPMPRAAQWKARRCNSRHRTIEAMARSFQTHYIGSAGLPGAFGDNSPGPYDPDGSCPWMDPWVRPYGAHLLL